MDERALFGKACEEAFMRQCEEDIANWTEPVKLSYSFYKKCSKIIGVNVIPRKYTVRRTFVLIAAAVLLLLTACAAYIYRDDIKGLFVECLNDHDKVCAGETLDNSEHESIRNVYYLSYIPEGYELVESEVNSTKAFYKYENAAGNTFIYSQKTTLTNGYIDRKSAKAICLNGIDYAVYYLHTSQSHRYSWYDGKYYNEIVLSDDILDDELEKIIDGISKK